MKTVLDTSTEDLLKSLKNASVSSNALESDDTLKAVDPVHQFIGYFNLKPGRNKVHKRILWDLFKSWDKKRTTRKGVFSLRMMNYFPTPPKQQYYMMSQTQWKLSNKAYAHLLKGHSELKTSFRLQKQYEAFLSYYGIVPGTFWVEIGALYYLYDKWKYRFTSKTSFTKKKFIAYCRGHFDVNVKDYVYYAKVDPGIQQHITDEARMQIVQGLQRKWTTNNKKKLHVPKPAANE